MSRKWAWSVSVWIQVFNICVFKIRNVFFKVLRFRTGEIHVKMGFLLLEEVFCIFMCLRLCLLTFCFFLFMFCDRCSLPFWHQSVCVRIWHPGSTFLVLRSFVSAADSLFISWNLRTSHMSEIRIVWNIRKWECRKENLHLIF